MLANSMRICGGDSYKLSSIGGSYVRARIVLVCAVHAALSLNGHNRPGFEPEKHIRPIPPGLH